MAGTINLANVALGFDASALTKGIDLSAGEIRKLGSVVKASESDLDKYANAMKLLDVAQQKGAITAERLAAAQDHLAKKYGIETYAMIEARQASEALIAKKKQQEEAAKQAAVNEAKYGEMLAQAQRDALERQKKIDAELAIGIGLRKQVATAEERMAANTKLYDQYLKQGIIDLQTYNRLLDQMKQKPVMSPLSQGGGGKIAGDLKSTLAQYAGMAAGFSALKNSLSLAATAESNRISLEVLTGSASKARMLFDGFIELDRNSPLSRADFSRASQTLIGYGFAAESTLPALRRLSEISIGNADRFQSLSLAFGQVTAAGRLMGQEVLQMVNAGFNPLQEISRTTGRSMIDLKKAMEDGAISAGMVEDAMKSATSEGGRFYEMNERLKNSAAGQWAKMQSDVQLLATEIGTNLLPLAKDLMTVLSGQSGEKSNAGAFISFLSDGARALVALSQVKVDPNSAEAWFREQQARKKGKTTNPIANLADDLQTRGMEKKLRDELIHKQTPEEIKAAEEKASRQRKEMEDLVKRQKWATEAEEQSKKEATEKEQKDREKLSKHFEDIHNKRMREAAELEKATLTPLQEYENELARIAELSMFGAISDEVAKLGKDRAGEKLIKQGNAAEKKSDPLNISQTIAPALKAGSVEAYKFMLNQKDKLYEAAQEQKQVSTETLSVAKQQLTAIQAIPKIGVKR